MRGQVVGGRGVDLHHLAQAAGLAFAGFIRVRVVGVAARLGRVALRIHGAHRAARLGGQPVDLLRAEDAALLQDLRLLRREGRGADRLAALVRLLLAGRELLDLLGDPHAAPVVAAHGAEVRVHVQVLVVVGPGRVGIERELEVLLPVERGPRLGQLVVTIARRRDAQGHVRRVGRDPVGDAALLHVVPLGETQVLLGRDVAEHAGAVVRRGGGADAARDVVVAREDVRHQRAQHVERRPVAEAALQLHVELDLVERNVPRPLDHHLHATAPCPLRELAQRGQLRQLGGVRGVGQSARTEAVADAEGHVPAPHHLADPLPRVVHEVLAVVHQHPLGQQAATAAHDADQAPPDQREVFAEDARVDGEVVHALAGLVLQRLQHHLLRQVLQAAADDHGVDGHRADRDRGGPDDGFAALVQVAAGGEIHHRVRAPALRPAELVHFLVGAAGHRRRAHVGVHLGARRAADGHGVQRHGEVGAVGGDHHSPCGHFVPDLLRREVSLPLRHAPHLRRDAPEAGVLKLRHRLETGGRHGADEAPGVRLIVAGAGHAVRAGVPAGARGIHRLDSPALRQEVPRGEVRGFRHPGGVRGAERPGAAHIRTEREASRRGPLGGA